MNNAKLHHGVIRFFLSLSFYFIIFSQNAGLLKSTIENYKTFVYELYGFTAIGLNKIMSKKKENIAEFVVPYLIKSMFSRSLQRKCNVQNSQILSVVKYQALSCILFPVLLLSRLWYADVVNLYANSSAIGNTSTCICRQQEHVLQKNLRLRPKPSLAIHSILHID